MIRRLSIVVAGVVVVLFVFLLQREIPPTGQPASIGATHQDRSEKTLTLPSPNSADPSRLTGAASERVASVVCAEQPVVDTGLSVADTRDERAALVENLSVSFDPEHRLAAILIGSKAETNTRDVVDELSALVPGQPEQQPAFWALVSVCGDHLSHPKCSDATLTATAERVDPDNGSVWALLAMHRFERGDHEGAQALLTRATTSPIATSYYAKLVAMFERAYAAGSRLSVSERLTAAIGDAVDLEVPILPVLVACQDVGEQELYWRELCREYGVATQQRSRTMIDTVLAIALQQTMAEFDNNADEVARLESVRKALQPYFVDERGVTLDEAVNMRYLAELSINGELAAMAYLGEEVARARAAQAACPPGLPANVPNPNE